MLTSTMYFHYKEFWMPISSSTLIAFLSLNTTTGTPLNANLTPSKFVKSGKPRQSLKISYHCYLPKLGGIDSKDLRLKGRDPKSNHPSSLSLLFLQSPKSNRTKQYLFKGFLLKLRAKGDSVKNFQK